MIDLLPVPPFLAAFVVASFVLAVTPGPGVLCIVSRSLAEGRRCGLASVLGVALGNFGNALGASLGLAMLFSVSAAAFSIVKYAGACYLIYLGTRTLQTSGSVPRRTDTMPMRLDLAVRDGFLVALLNPKTALFFAAFLPQFLVPGEVSMLQTVVLGALFVVIAAMTDATYALVAGTVAPALAGPSGFPSVARYVSGGTFIGLGLFTAFSSSHRTK
jgi:threonine/homoserine/homoserine lactone efflux protein